jgi:hypothetical protein
MKRIAFSQLSSANLVIDAIYESNRSDSKSTYGSEPLHHLIPGVGNAGGFRKRMDDENNLLGVLLTSTGGISDWPDELDPYTGTYTYYGDNRKPGQELHQTKFLGNLELSKMFALAHGNAAERAKCPLIFIFESGENARDYVFKGMAVPGTSYLSRGEDLVAIWRVSNGQRFQNYRAAFTILDEAEISGSWVREVFASRTIDLKDERVPKSFIHWIEKGKYTPLIATRAVSDRATKDQLPEKGLQEDLVNCILDYCKLDPYLFEPIAAAIWKLSCMQPMEYELTRKYRDGGRDAIGYLIVGPITDPIKMTFALEAKCYSLKNKVGVKEVSRLISRIKQREFGVLVTTSTVDSQAYKEIRTDGHPIVIIPGKDIAQILIKCGINTTNKCLSWIESVVG